MIMLAIKLEKFWIQTTKEDILLCLSQEESW